MLFSFPLLELFHLVCHYHSILAVVTGNCSVLIPCILLTTRDCLHRHSLVLPFLFITALPLIFTFLSFSRPVADQHGRERSFVPG